MCMAESLTDFKILSIKYNGIGMRAVISRSHHKCLRYLRLHRWVLMVLIVSAVGFIIYAVVRKNLLGISTSQQRVWRTLRAKCDTCSLVTNSGDLIGSYAGTKIDETDCVIRINDAPTSGFEDDVGKKTTIRIVDGKNVNLISRSFRVNEPTPLHTILYYEENSQVPISTETSVKSRQGTQLGVQSSIVLHRNDAILQRVQRLIVHALSKGQNIHKSKERWSVAFVAVLFSHDICGREVNVYGLSSPSYCDKYQKYAHDAPRNYYPPGDEEQKCPLSRKFDNVLWTSNLDSAETHAVFKLAELSNKLRFREYTMDIARKR